MLVPPAKAFLQEAYARSGLCKMRILVGPWPDQSFFRTGQVLEQAEDGVRVPIRPTTHRIDRHLNVGIVFADRAVSVELVSPLVAEPVEHPQPVAFQALHPHLPPAVSHDCGIGRRVADREGRGPPAQLVGQHAATHEVDVVGVAIVGGAERNDRAQRFGTPCCDLKPVESAPADPDHADLSRAPGLGGKPLDHGQAVVLFLLEILAQADAFAVTRAAQVDTNARISVACEIRMGQVITLNRTVTLAIGQVLENCRHWIRFRIKGKPDPGREPCPVRHRDPDVLDLADFTREIGSDF